MYILTSAAVPCQRALTDTGEAEVKKYIVLGILRGIDDWLMESCDLPCSI